MRRFLPVQVIVIALVLGIYAVSEERLDYPAIQKMSDLGVSIIGPRSVGSTDHAAFDAVGLPAFQFLVERLEYRSRTHHSNMDVFDRVQRENMIQQATVAAVFAYCTAMADEMLPRKALPRPSSQRAGPPR